MLYLVISPDTVLIIINLVRNHLFKMNNRTVRSTGQISSQLTMGFHNRVHWPLLVSRFNVHFEQIQHLVCLILTLNEQLLHFWEELQYEKYLIWNSWGMVKNNIGNTVCDNSCSAYAKFSEKLTFLTLGMHTLSVRIRG